MVQSLWVHLGNSDARLYNGEWIPVLIPVKSITRPNQKLVLHSVSCYGSSLFNQYAFGPPNVIYIRILGQTIMCMGRLDNSELTRLNNGLRGVVYNIQDFNLGRIQTNQDLLLEMRFECHQFPGNIQSISFMKTTTVGTSTGIRCLSRWANGTSVGNAHRYTLNSSSETVIVLNTLGRPSGPTIANFFPIYDQNLNQIGVLGNHQTSIGNYNNTQGPEDTNYLITTTTSATPKYAFSLTAGSPPTIVVSSFVSTTTVPTLLNAIGVTLAEQARLDMEYGYNTWWSRCLRCVANANGGTHCLTIANLNTTRSQLRYLRWLMVKANGANANDCVVDVSFQFYFMDGTMSLEIVKVNPAVVPTTSPPVGTERFRNNELVGWNVDLYMFSTYTKPLKSFSMVFHHYYTGANYTTLFGPLLLQSDSGVVLSTCLPQDVSVRLETK